MAAKDQALRTNSIKRMIDKQNVSAKCKMCVEGDETVSHLYRNARNLLKSKIEVGGTTSWRRRFIGNYVESWVMTGMKNITMMSHNKCVN